MGILTFLVPLQKKLLWSITVIALNGPTRVSYLTVEDPTLLSDVNPPPICMFVISSRQCPLAKGHRQINVVQGLDKTSSKV